MLVDAASNAIRRAESDLRGLIGQAAAAGQYELVGRLSGIARRLAVLAEEASDRGPPADLARAMESQPARRLSGKGDAAKRKQAVKAHGYPRFERMRDLLIKVGWSRKKRSEYVHKAPKEVMLELLRRVRESGESRAVFAAEDLLSMRSSSAGDEIPSYQAYLCIAWFREIGVLEQHGREGYSVRVEDIEESVGRAWNSLSVLGP